jgi:endonuclease/exonuclease/phosphatase (EEP) superfamily protein YafD
LSIRWIHTSRCTPRGADLIKARSITAIVVGIPLLALATIALAVRYIDIPGHRTLYAVVVSPYLIPVALAAVLVFVWGRRWILTALACCVVAGFVIPQLPWYVRAPDTDESEQVALRMMTSNMLYGEGDAETITRTAEADADVVMLQELTPTAVAHLTKAGINRTFPFRVVQPGPLSEGIGIYSRFPLQDVTRVPGFRLTTLRARVRVPGTARDTTLMTVHLDAPWPRPIAGWHHDFDQLPTTLNALATQANGAPVIVGGDFNATIDMLPFRDLLTNGYRDAAEQAGAGRELTYPANRRRLPPFMGLDHFLTRDCTATTTRTVEIPGSDHLAVLATIMMPRS